MEINIDGMWDVDRSEVYRHLRYRPGKTRVSDAAEELVDREIERARLWLKPKARVVHGEVRSVSNPSVELDFGGIEVSWKSKSLARLLDPCPSLSLMLTTLGFDFDSTVQSAMATGDAARATVLDAVGSAAIESAAKAVSRWIESCAVEQGCSVTWRMAPGYADWSLEAQDELVVLVEGDALGVEVTPAHVMRPEKTLSGVVGWVPFDDPKTEVIDRVRALEPCARCSLVDCDQRRAEYRPGANRSRQEAQTKGGTTA